MSEEEIRAELAAIATLQSELPARRAAAVQRAREAEMTWREIALILGMTEHGLIKAAKNADKSP